MAVLVGIDTRLARLSRAQDRRLERAALLRALEARQLDPAALVLDPPDCITGMFTFDFLRHVPRVGGVWMRRANQTAMRDGINLAVALGELTPLKREWLARRLSVRRDPKPVPAGTWPLAGRPQG